MITEIIWPKPEKHDLKSDLPNFPVIIVNNNNPSDIVLLTKFCQYEDGTYAYHGYNINNNFSPRIIWDYHDINDWSKFKGRIVLSNCMENK